MPMKQLRRNGTDRAEEEVEGGRLMMGGRCAHTLTRKLLSLSWVTMTTESWSFSSKWTWLWEPSASWPAAKRILRTLGLLPGESGRGLQGLQASSTTRKQLPLIVSPPPATALDTTQHPLARLLSGQGHILLDTGS